MKHKTARLERRQLAYNGRAYLARIKPAGQHKGKALSAIQILQDGRPCEIVPEQEMWPRLQQSLIDSARDIFNS